MQEKVKKHPKMQGGEGRVGERSHLSAGASLPGLWHPINRCCWVSSPSPSALLSTAAGFGHRGL